MAKIPRVSIVIPAYNEQRCIEKCLFSLLESQQTTKVNYEVILVDNQCTDKTVELAQQFKEAMNLKIVSEAKQGRGPARARGFREAKGQIILSGDADTIFYKDWIETLVREIKDEVVAVTTSCKIVDRSALTNLVFNLSQPKLMVVYRLVFGHYWLSGYSFGILKSVYEDSGRFNSSLHGHEDLDLSFRVAKMGKIKFINKPVIFSGRRFKNGLLFGVYDYIQTFIEAFVLRKKNFYLDNPR